jgi:hypothetical protein
MGVFKFVYYISLFSYSLRSLCQNEFLADSYDALVALDPVTQLQYEVDNPSTKGTSVAQLCKEVGQGDTHPSALTRLHSKVLSGEPNRGT